MAPAPKRDAICDRFQRHSFKLTFKLKVKSVRGLLFTFDIFEKKAGSGSYEDLSIRAIAGAGAAEAFYSEPKPESDYFPAGLRSRVGWSR